MYPPDKPSPLYAAHGLKQPDINDGYAICPLARVNGQPHMVRLPIQGPAGPGSLEGRFFAVCDDLNIHRDRRPHWHLFPRGVAPAPQPQPVAQPAALLSPPAPALLSPSASAHLSLPPAPRVQCADPTCIRAANLNCEHEDGLFCSSHCLARGGCRLHILRHNYEHKHEKAVITVIEPQDRSRAALDAAIAQNAYARAAQQAAFEARFPLPQSPPAARPVIAGLPRRRPVASSSLSSLSPSSASSSTPRIVASSSSSRIASSSTTASPLPSPPRPCKKRKTGFKTVIYILDSDEEDVVPEPKKEKGTKKATGKGKERADVSEGRSEKKSGKDNNWAF